MRLLLLVLCLLQAGVVVVKARPWFVEFIHTIIPEESKKVLVCEAVHEALDLVADPACANRTPVYIGVFEYQLRVEKIDVNMTQTVTPANIANITRILRANSFFQFPEGEVTLMVPEHDAKAEAIAAIVVFTFGMLGVLMGFLGFYGC